MVASAAAIRPGIGARAVVEVVGDGQRRPAEVLRPCCARARQPGHVRRAAALDPEPERVHGGQSAPAGRGLRCPPMGDLSGYEKDTFTFAGKTRDVYRKGEGPARAGLRGDARHHPEGARLRRSGRRARVHRGRAPPLRRPRGRDDRRQDHQGHRPGVRVEGVLGLGHRQDQPGRRVVEGAGPPRARAARRTRRRGRRHVLHRQLRPRHAPGARGDGAGPLPAVPAARVHEEGAARRST